MKQYYNAVISSYRYPERNNERDHYIYIISMPSGAYITYTLITQEENQLRDNKQISVHNLDSIDSFTSSVTSPFSQIVDRDVRVYTTRGDDDLNPAFLLMYKCV